LANIKSAKKRILQNEKRRIRNRVFLTRTRTYVKSAKMTMDDGDYPASEKAVLEAISELDKAVSKGVIHRNNAARRKSRLIAHLNKMKNVEVAEK